MVRLSALNLKLLRDLWRMKGQGLAIGAVVACGIALQVTMFGTLAALEEGRLAFYDRYRFAEVWAGVKRAPNILLNRVEQIPGVAAAETRIVVDVTLDVPGMTEPGIGRLISLPRQGRPRLNDLALLDGRFPSLSQPDEVVVSDSFAKAHKFSPGDSFFATMNGVKRELVMVGRAMSPEYSYSLGPGMIMPDDELFGVMWMSRDALEAAFDLEGAFNDVSLRLLRGASEEEVIRRLDLLLETYGGVGAYGREDQISDFFLTNEFSQLRTFGTIIPLIFLGIAAFLVNIVVTRIVQTEREQIGLLKAFGYTDWEVGWVYLKLILVIMSIGLVFGLIGGHYLGKMNTEMYGEYYKFPLLPWEIDPSVFSFAALVSLSAAAVGGWSAVRRAVALSPAVAMAPPVPTSFKSGLFTEFSQRFRLTQPTRMIFRHVVRWPLRSGMTALGLAFATATFIVSAFFIDSIEQVIDVYYHQAERQDMTVSFVEPKPARIEEEFKALPGVLSTQPARGIAVRMSVGHLSSRETIRGLAERRDLNRILNQDIQSIDPPEGGIALSANIAEKLGVGLGDMVVVEVLQGRRPIETFPVTQLVEEYLGFAGYMRLDQLNRFMGDGPTVSAIHLLVDTRYADQLYDDLKATPAVAAIAQTTAALESFETVMDETVMVMITIYVAFSGFIAFGVSYNSARIALSERSRTLASLRVLGFHRGEIVYILIGELAVITLISLPVGLIIGRGLVQFMSPLLKTEVYDFPLVVDPATFGLAASVTLGASILCWLLMARRLYGLDLVSVLKTRE